jgi:hypothetical protein
MWTATEQEATTKDEKCRRENPRRASPRLAALTCNNGVNLIASETLPACKNLKALGSRRSDICAKKKDRSGGPQKPDDEQSESKETHGVRSGLTTKLSDRRRKRPVGCNSR